MTEQSKHEELRRFAAMAMQGIVSCNAELTFAERAANAINHAQVLQRQLDKLEGGPGCEHLFNEYRNGMTVYKVCELCSKAHKIAGLCDEY